MTPVLFASDAHRCQELDLQMKSDMAYEVLQGPTRPLKFGAPRKWRIAALDGYDNVILFRTAAHLTHLWISLGRLEDSFTRFVPWMNVQSLRLNEVNIPPKTLLQVLGQTRTLSSLIVHADGTFDLMDDDDHHLPINAVTIPSLTHFRLYFGRVTETSQILAQNMRAPKLRCLEVQSACTEDLRTLESFMRSSTSVTSFSVNEVKFRERDNIDEHFLPVLLSILRGLTALERFRLGLINVDRMLNLRPLLGRLTFSPNQEATVPDLKELHLVGPRAGLTSHQLQDLVEGRLSRRGPDRSYANTSGPQLPSALQALYLQKVFIFECATYNSQGNGYRNSEAAVRLRWLLDAEEAGSLVYGVNGDLEFGDDLTWESTT
ncbi:hypothetical protein BDV98DRAFT_223868 [Pterulicium gracile]|uniref:F-box domain-containing protein n=1 Tax=Pterulicium gracile TaxID=1884261 RepID=A0A5C3QU59_9AGAR|nr:hypothetical protein BDV98DRAFT_223868 [Pterula gracilis]